MGRRWSNALKTSWEWSVTSRENSFMFSSAVFQWQLINGQPVTAGWTQTEPDVACLTSLTWKYWPIAARLSQDFIGLLAVFSPLFFHTFPLLTPVCGLPLVTWVRLNKPPSKPYHHRGWKRVRAQQSVWFEALTRGQSCQPAKACCPVWFFYKQQLCIMLIFSRCNKHSCLHGLTKLMHSASLADYFPWIMQKTLFFIRK